MKSIIALILFSVFNLTLPVSNDESQPSDYKIARAVREAVRNADPELLKSTLTGNWREYLKLAAMELDMELQPLVLIKFDEDISFRNQLKKIVEWEANWQRQETRHYIYYYRWDHPLPELILEVQDVHFQEICSHFGIELEEKIPYRYDLEITEGKVYPFEDLRGGIVSCQPFDLEKAALAILCSVNPDMRHLTEPLARIYGSYFQNESTSQAYYESCLQKVKTGGYRRAAEFLADATIESSETQSWYSAYTFGYKLNEQFGPQKIAEFLRATRGKMDEASIAAAFKQTFEIELTEFENNNEFYQAAQKL